MTSYSGINKKRKSNVVIWNYLPSYSVICRHCYNINHPTVAKLQRKLKFKFHLLKGKLNNLQKNKNLNVYYNIF